MAWLRGALALLTGAGRPRTYTVAKIYKLEPETIERIKTIAQTTAADRIVAAFSGPEKIDDGPPKAPPQEPPQK
jgi:hypothetical protein